MELRVPGLRFSLDPLIAEAKRRMRRRRALVAVVAVAFVAGAVGAVLALRGPDGRHGIGPRVTRIGRLPVQHIGAGPFVLSGGFAGGSGSGLWGDGASGPQGTTVGCIDRRHYSEAFGIKNRSRAPVTLVSARGANPAPEIIDLVAIQLRLSPPLPRPPRPSSVPNWGGPVGGGLRYRGWSAAPTRPLTIPPRRIATVQSNYLMHRCSDLTRGGTIVVPGSVVLGYRASGRLHRKTIPLPGQRIVVVPGPTRRVCDPVAGSAALVSADTGCQAARRSALACHPMSHNSWGVCTVGGVLWDCGSTAGPGSPYLETCYLPRKKSHWFRVRWYPRRLATRG